MRLPSDCRMTYGCQYSTRRNFLGTAAAAAASLTLAASPASVSAAALPVAPPRAFTPLGSTSTLALADDAVEFWSGLLAGAVQKTAKELVLHPLDTAKTRLQLGGSRRALVGGGLFDDAYSGIGPALLSGAPAASLFFAVKDGIKSRAKGLGKVGATLAAVAGANVCYWVLRNPTEVVKARRQAGIDGDAAAAAAALWARSGPAGFYVGYLGNLAYAYPVDASKFLLYEAYKRDAKRRSGGAPLPALDAAVAGALSAAAAQSVATPLDVARTRIMTGGAAPDANAVPLVAEIFRDEGIGALYAGIEPKAVRALLSGAIQFSTYEATKRWARGVLVGRG